MKFKLLGSIFLALMFLSGCSNEKVKQPETTKAPDNRKRDSALTQERQANLTIDQIIQQFKAGNERFIKDESIQYNYIEQVKQSGSGQFPKAIVLGCIDSRAPVEEVFDKGIGEIFGSRVAGNYADPGVIGGIEFACKVMGSKVIIVLGHTDCGAIKGACDNVELGNITVVMDELKPAVNALKDFPGEHSSKNKEFVKEVTKKNVDLTMKKILDKSAIISEMVKDGQVKILGAMYDVSTGKVDFLY